MSIACSFSTGGVGGGGGGIPGTASVETLLLVMLSAISDPMESETMRTRTWDFSNVTVDRAPVVAPVSCIVQPTGRSQENVLSMAV